MREVKFQIFDSTPKNIGGQRMYTWEEYCAELAEDFPLHAILSGEVSDLIPRQFTGLKDKNRREIYEGDIIKISFSKTVLLTQEVHWREFYGDYGINIHGYTEPLGLFYNDTEVIGNIHENPELLDGSK